MSMLRSPLGAPVRPLARKVTEAGGGGLLNSPVVVFLGDSITEQNGGIPANPGWMFSGFYQHGRAYSGQEITAVNKGVAGQTSAQMLARLATDVIALAPRYCHLLCGTNDVSTGVATATTLANISSMISQLRAAGISVAIGTIPPRSSYTGSQKADTDALNAAIRALSGVTVIDYYAPLDDGAGVALGGTMSDGLHPNRNGASRMGIACAAWLASLPTQKYPLFTDAGATSTQLLVYNRFQSGADGAVPTGWSAIATNTPTYSREARSDGISGNWLVVQNDIGDVVSLTSNVNVGGSLAVGNTIRAEVEAIVSPLASPPVKSSAFGLYLQFWNGSSFFSSIGGLRWDGSQDNDHDVMRSGVWRTPDVVVPSGTTIAQIVIQCQGAGTFKLDRAAIRKTT